MIASRWNAVKASQRGFAALRAVLLVYHLLLPAIPSSSSEPIPSKSQQFPGFSLFRTDLHKSSGFRESEGQNCVSGTEVAVPGVMKGSAQRKTLLSSR